MDDKDTALPKSDALPSGLSGAIESILAHPELISMVASALGKSPPADQPASTDQSAVGEDASAPVSAAAESPPQGSAPEAITALAPLLSGLSGIAKASTASPGKKDDPRACLLRALKPYLSAGRCEAIDTILRLSVLSDALRSLNNRP